MPPFTLRRRRRIVHAASIRHRSTYAVDVSSMPLPFVTAAHTPILWTVGLGQTLSLHPDLCLTPATSQHFTAASISAQHSHSTSQQPAQPQYLTAASTASTSQQPAFQSSTTQQYNTAAITAQYSGFPSDSGPSLSASIRAPCSVPACRFPRRHLLLLVSHQFQCVSDLHDELLQNQKLLLRI